MDVGGDDQMGHYGGGEEVLGMGRKVVKAAAVSGAPGDERSIGFACAVNGPRESVDGVAQTYLLMSEVLCHPEDDQIYLVRIVETLKDRKCHGENQVLLFEMVGGRKLIGTRRS